MSEEKATCRGCGLVLNGKPYYMGGHAYHPRTGNRCHANHYGGFVCSEVCDRRATLEHEQTMPGHSGQVRISTDLARAITNKWADA